MKINEVIKQPKYNFLHENEHLKDRIMFLTFGGSHAYGTNTPTSDIDIRGCAMPLVSDLIGLTNFEQVIDKNTDTTVYAFPKLVKLLLNCNPNCIELLGCKPEFYTAVSPAGKLLLENRNIFLSKRAINSFGGYALGQINRLMNAIARDRMLDVEKEEHILRSCKAAMLHFNDRYASYADGSLQLYTDKSVKEEFENEIFIDINLNHYPLRDFKAMIDDMQAIIKDYAKSNHRNSKKDIPHLGKHMMHLIRLYMMVCDILEKGEIITYRTIEHDLLMDIRNGKYLTENGQCTNEFMELTDEYTKRFEYAKQNTILPASPDFNKVNELTMEINRMVLV